MSVPTPAEKSAVEGSSPTSSGTRTVAPKATNRYWIPEIPLRIGLNDSLLVVMLYEWVFFECKSTHFLLMWEFCPDKRIKIQTNSECWERNAVSTKPKAHSGHWNYLINQAKAKTKFPILKTTAKSAQTSAEVSRKYYVLTNLSTTYLHSQVRVLMKVSTRKYFCEYVVLIISASIMMKV